MKIKWKFEEDVEDFDEHGNLKNYYKDSEPWKKQNSKPNYFLQVFLIILAVIVCLLVIVIGLSYQGYDWNQAPGLRILREIVDLRLRR
ncbi:MAG: hypothetical protein FWG09_00175 [Synergistaceae bacterium]|nr:hypothetical protein [Synergistaceae bacterium]